MHAKYERCEIENDHVIEYASKGEWNEHVLCICYELHYSDKLDEMTEYEMLSA